MLARVAMVKIPDEKNQINPMIDAFLRKAREFAERLPSVLTVSRLIASRRPTTAKLERKLRYFESVSSTSSDTTISL
jgi:hypothetical protein